MIVHDYRIGVILSEGRNLGVAFCDAGRVDRVMGVGRSR